MSFHGHHEEFYFTLSKLIRPDKGILLKDYTYGFKLVITLNYSNYRLIITM